MQVLLNHALTTVVYAIDVGVWSEFLKSMTQCSNKY